MRTNYLTSRWHEKGGYRELLVMAFPLILSTGASSVLNFVDRMFLTWYSPESIAAAMPGGIVNFTIMSFFIGTAGYVNTFVAQYSGAQRPERIGPSLWQGLYVAAAGGAIVAVVSLFSAQIFDFFGHAVEIRTLEANYFRILARWAIFPIASSVFAGYFSGRGKNWPIMWANFIGLLVNIVLDYLMIFGKLGFAETGIVGAARATAIAGAVVFVFYALLTFTPANERRHRVLSGFHLDRELLGRIFRFGAPSGVQFFVDMSGFSMFILIVGRLGMMDLAATNIAFNVNMLAFMPMLGFGIAISVMVGQFQGEGNSAKAQRSVYSGAHICFLYMTIIAISYVAMPGVYVSAFASRANPASFEQIRSLVIVLLRFVAMYTVFDTLNIVFASALKGAGDTRFVMFMIVALSVFGLIVPTYIAVSVAGTNIIGAWIIVSIYVALLGLSFLTRFLSGRWKTIELIESQNTTLPLTFPAVPSSE